MRQLVKGDLSSEYHADVRQWIEDIEQSGGVGDDERNSRPLPGECTLSLATLHPLDGELTG
jgi:hypothetical protein